MSLDKSQLVPITREVLRVFYSKNPLKGVPRHDVNQHTAALEDLKQLVGKPGSKVSESVNLDTPLRIDDCFWRSRLLCEEAAHSLNAVIKKLGSAAPDTLVQCCAQLLEAERAVLKVQDSNTEAAASQIREFLPKDFRAGLLEMRRSTQEARNQRAVDDLLKKGKSIRARYELYLQQQWERREALVQMGQLSGVFKLMVKYIGGVPQVLLDFAKEINAKVGPMEEQRICYGPDLYMVCDVGNSVNILAAMWAEHAENCKSHMQQVLDVMVPAVAFFCEHLMRVIKFLGVLFTKSPFFVTQAAVKAAEAEAEVARSNTGPAGASPSLCLATSLQARDSLEEQNDWQAESGFQPHCGEALLAAVGVHRTSLSLAHSTSHPHRDRCSMSRSSLPHAEPSDTAGAGQPSGPFLSRISALLTGVLSGGPSSHPPTPTSLCSPRISPQLHGPHHTSSNSTTSTVLLPASSGNAPHTVTLHASLQPPSLAGEQNTSIAHEHKPTYAAVLTSPAGHGGSIVQPPQPPQHAAMTAPVLPSLAIPHTCIFVATSKPPSVAPAAVQPPVWCSQGPGGLESTLSDQQDTLSMASGAEYQSCMDNMSWVSGRISMMSQNLDAMEEILEEGEHRRISTRTSGPSMHPGTAATWVNGQLALPSAGVGLATAVSMPVAVTSSFSSTLPAMNTHAVSLHTRPPQSDGSSQSTTTGTAGTGLARAVFTYNHNHTGDGDASSALSGSGSGPVVSMASDTATAGSPRAPADALAMGLPSVQEDGGQEVGGHAPATGPSNSRGAKTRLDSVKNNTAHNTQPQQLRGCLACFGKN